MKRRNQIDIKAPSYTEPLSNAMVEQLSKHHILSTPKEYLQKIQNSSIQNPEIQSLLSKVQNQYGDLKQFIAQSDQNKSTLNFLQLSFTLFPNQIQNADRAFSSALREKVQEQYLLSIKQLFDSLFLTPTHIVVNNQIINTQLEPNAPFSKFNLQIINGLLAKLLDRFLNSNIFAFKNIIASIFIAHAKVFKLNLIKDEIVQILGKGIKGNDEYTRVMTCKIIPEYTELLQKDLAIFEHVLHRIKSFDFDNDSLSFSTAFQAESFRGCLKSMFEKSSQLSMLFVKSLESQVESVHFNNLKDNLFVNQILITHFYQICLSLKLGTTEYAKIFKSLLILYRNRSQPIREISPELNEKLKESILRLFEVYFEHNFKILQIFYEQGISEVIQLNTNKILEKIMKLDQNQKEYIYQSSPQMWKKLLQSQQAKTNPIKINKIQTFFLKSHAQLNDFPEVCEPYQISEYIRVKQRRLIQFKELCNYRKQTQINSLIEAWIKIYSIVSLALQNSLNPQIQKEMDSLRNDLQFLSRNSENLKEQIEIAAWVYLCLSKSLEKQNLHIFFNQQLWKKNPKLHFSHSHFLKWTFFRLENIQNIIFQ